MSTLTEEQYNQVPEFLKDDYEKDGDSFIHKGLKKVKQTANSLDEKSKQTAKELAEAREELNTFKQEKEQALKDKRDKELENAEDKGDVKAIKERYEQQMEDLKKRVAEETRNEVTTEFTSKLAAEKEETIISDFSGELAKTANAARTLKIVLKGRVKIDPSTGKETYFDANGSALSVDKVGFLADLKKDVTIEDLIKADFITTGGGKVDGSNGGRTTVGQNKAADEARKKGDLAGFLKANLG